jgi:uncharacterized cupredoxin-like copper-binding protein
LYIRNTAVFVVAALISGAVYGHGDSHGKKPAERPAAASIQETTFGRSGDPMKVTRTIRVGMDDTMHFSSGHVHARQGDTIEFVVTNRGKIMHEMVIGTMKELKGHAELMRKHPGMEHDEPYMAHVGPGKSETIVWQFTKTGDFRYACLIPGHLEAGMIDKITIEPKKVTRLSTTPIARR